MAALGQLHAARAEAAGETHAAFEHGGGEAPLSLRGVVDQNPGQEPLRGGRDGSGRPSFAASRRVAARVRSSPRFWRGGVIWLSVGGVATVVASASVGGELQQVVDVQQPQSVFSEELRPGEEHRRAPGGLVDADQLGTQRGELREERQRGLTWSPPVGPLQRYNVTWA